MTVLRAARYIAEQRSYRPICKQTAHARNPQNLELSDSGYRLTVTFDAFRRQDRHVSRVVLFEFPVAEKSALDRPTFNSSIACSLSPRVCRVMSCIAVVTSETLFVDVRQSHDGGDAAPAPDAAVLLLLLQQQPEIYSIQFK